MAANRPPTFRILICLALLGILLGGFVPPESGAAQIPQETILEQLTPEGLTPTEWQDILQSVQESEPQRQPDRYSTEILLSADDAGPYDEFGVSVAIDGDTLVVGAIYDSERDLNAGAAYVFTRNADGAGGTGADHWGQVQKLTAIEGSEGDRFGISIAISGDTIVIGADGDDDKGTNSGAAYVFQRNNEGADQWGRVQKLVASDGAKDDSFGISVAISGDTIVVGSRYDDDKGVNSGSAYVYQRNRGGADKWGQVQKLTASDGNVYDIFGQAVAINGDTIVVGADNVDDNGSGSGAAFVFQRNQGGVNNWGQVQKLTASDGAQSDAFGWDVAISGDTIVIGAYGDDDNGDLSGSAYVFQRNQGGVNNWGQVQKLTASDGAQSDIFGETVAINGDMIVIGAYSDDNAAGSAYVFTRNRDGVDWWGQTTKLIPSTRSAWDRFGQQVSISNDTILVGAPDSSPKSITEAGAAYLFPADAVPYQPTRKVMSQVPEEDGYFGASVSISGDTLVVGEPGDDFIETNRGSAAVFVRNNNGEGGRSADAWGLVRFLTAPDGDTYDHFGYAVAMSGDTLVVGSPTADAAYVFQRNKGGTDQWGFVRKLTAPDGSSGDYFGESVGISGDTIVVGTFVYAGQPGYWPGYAYVFERNSDGAGGAAADHWGAVKKLESGDPAAASFGESVAIDGNTIIVGAQADNHDAAWDSTYGSAWIFSRNKGGADQWGIVKELTASDKAKGDVFGFAIAVDGDLIGVSAPWHDAAGEDTGAVYLFSRNQGGPDNWGQVRKLLPATTTEDHFGWSIAVHADRVVVGAPEETSQDGAPRGTAYIFKRNSDGSGGVAADQWGQSQKIYPHNQDYDFFGNSVALDQGTLAVGAADFNYGGDAQDDHKGSAFLFTDFQPQQIWFDEAHDNIATLDWDRAQALADSLPWLDPEWAFYGQLQEEMAPPFNLVRKTNPLSFSALNSYDAVIMSLPAEPLSEAETNDLRRYVNQGGGLILIGDCGFWDPNSALSAEFGLYFDPHCLFEPVPDPVDDLNGDLHIINFLYEAPVSGVTTFDMNWGQAVMESSPAFWLADTIPLDAWRDGNDNGQYDPGEEGAWNILAAYDEGCGRVAAVGDDGFTDGALGAWPNEYLMRALLVWVTEGHPCANNPPDEPNTPTPADGETDVPTDTTLSWNADSPAISPMGDQDGDPVTFDVYLNGSLLPACDDLTGTTCDPGALAEDTTYQWYVVASDGQDTTQGPDWTFTTIKSNQPPHIPHTPSPAHNATDTPTNTTLRWSGGDPDSGDTVTYNVYWVDGYPTPLCENISQTACSPPSALAEDTTYHWFVIASDGEDTTQGPDWTFTTIKSNQPPHIPHTPSPAHNATDISTNTTLRWSGGDPDSGDSVTYSVYWVDGYPTPLCENISQTACSPPSTLAEDTTYHWFVIASDGEDNTQGPDWTFTTARSIWMIYLPFISR